MAIIPDDQMRPLVLALIQSGSGAACEFGLQARISQLPGGLFWVTSEPPDGKSLWGQQFESAEEAVNTFLALRHKHRVGLDYEAEDAAAQAGSGT